MPYYAELDENNVCKAVTQTHSEIIAATMIELDSYDISLLGQTYADGVWTPAPAVEPEPDPVQEGLLTIMVALADMYEQMIGGV